MLVRAPAPSAARPRRAAAGDRRPTPTTGSWPRCRTCPHVLANVLVSQAAGALAAGDERLPATGPSFRGRAPGWRAHPTAIWTDIYLSNSDALTDEIDATLARLQQIRVAHRRPATARAVTAWNDEAAADRRRLLERRAGRRPAVRDPRLGAQPARGGGRSSPSSSAAPGVNITDMALYPAADMTRGRGRAVDLRRGRRRACRTSSWPRSASRWRGHERQLRPRHAPARLDRPAGRQVDLASGGDHRRDGRRAGADRQLPATPPTPTRRWQRSAELGAIVERRDGVVADPRVRAAQRPAAGRPDRRRQRRHADAAAPGLAGVPAGRAASRSTATTRSAAGRSTASPSRCGGWARGSRPATAGSPPFTVHGRSLRGAALRASGGQRRRSSPACCWPGWRPTGPR